MLDMLLLVVAVLMGVGYVACRELLAAIDRQTCLGTLAFQQTFAASVVRADAASAGIGCPCTAVAAALARPAPPPATAVPFLCVTSGGDGTR
jgi:hypothetical protein